MKKHNEDQHKDNYTPKVVHMACRNRISYRALLDFCSNYRQLNGDVISVEHVQKFNEKKYQKINGDI